MVKLALKDLRLFFKDKRSMILTFLVPMTLITLFAFAFGGTGGNEEGSKEYDLPVCDLDHTEASALAVEDLDSGKTIHVVNTELKAGQEAVKKGKEDCLLIFHKGFADSLADGNPLPVELQYDQAKEMEVAMLQQSLMMMMMKIQYSNIGNPQMTMNKRFDKMLGNSDAQLKEIVHAQFDTLYRSIAKGMEENTDTTTEEAGFGMDTGIKMTKLVEEKEDNSLGLIHAVAGTAIMMLLFSVAGMGASLLDEKQEGTLKKLLYSPMHPNNILFGKMISANVISIMQLTVMFIYAKIAFGLDILSHLSSLILMIIVTAYACSSFGVLLASFAKSRQQVQGLSTLIVLIMSCIGGSMIPTFIMPVFMQKISVISVNYWGIQGFYDIFWLMLPLTDTTFLTRVLMLIIIGTVLNLVAFRMFKRNILKIV